MSGAIDWFFMISSVAMFMKTLLNILGAFRELHIKYSTRLATETIEEERKNSLHSSALANDVENAVRLLNDGADVDEGDSDGYTALFYAAQEGHVEMLSLLLDRGACVNRTIGVFENTPLRFALSSRNVEAARLLIERGALVNKPGSRYAPIFAIPYNWDIQMLDLLLEKGVNVDEADEEGVTMLMRSVMSRNAEVAYFLINAGANIEQRDHQGMNALMRAAIRGDLRIFARLVDAGARIDSKCHLNMTPLGYALLYNNHHVAAFIKDKNIKKLRDYPEVMARFVGRIASAECTPCSVCLEDTDIRGAQPIAYIDACTHAFHFECFREWHSKSPICPNCRAEVREWFKYDGKDLDFATNLMHAEK